jgi:hypothetical protein
MRTGYVRTGNVMNDMTTGYMSTGHLRTAHKSIRAVFSRINTEYNVHNRPTTATDVINLGQNAE